MNAEQILKQLIADVKNPEIANAAAALTAVREAETLFGGDHGKDQERGTEAQAPRAGSQGKAEAKRSSGVGRIDGRSKAARARRAKGIVREESPGIDATIPAQIAQG